MKRNFVVRKEAAYARFVPMRVVEPNFRHEVRPGFPRAVRALVNAQIQLDSINPITNDPKDEYLYGYNAGKRQRAQEYASEAHLAALKTGDAYSADRIREKFQLTLEQQKANMILLSTDEMAALFKNAKTEHTRKPLFLEQGANHDSPETRDLIGQLVEMRHILLEEGADRMEAFCAYCKEIVNNILAPDSD